MSMYSLSVSVVKQLRVPSPLLFQLAKFMRLCVNPVRVRDTTWHAACLVTGRRRYSVVLSRFVSALIWGLSVNCGLS